VARAVAVNVAANTNLPGFRGPVYPDGRFEYVPIPEREPVAEGASVPTYADLDLSFPVPESVADRAVHLDPSFAGVHGAAATTYGDEHGVKARPIRSLAPGDRLLFYATLALHPAPETVGDAPPSGVDADPDLPPEWGAYLIGAIVVDRVVDGGEVAGMTPEERAAAGVADNAHLRRADPDPEVIVAGREGSGLFERAVPLSTPTAGADANRLVTELSNDSGKGPWWRRVLRYDEAGTAALLAAIDEAQP